ncbi:DUF4292 domain-containing protein [Sinomicrobium pectinilyticum]|uniref:DUF4292 domain-containing protein n=1 Tax=Sinomicrobium pectinilyticum TaxID=1084421 RepID=A0A3N0ELB7_SINP1|nr:DUF4292 domain-containing protein [Sinomicrobium pectinilyticum]RNL88696.1 DUF4292 domain-containing protein [Sinomicrobium pectinilyticum]
MKQIQKIGIILPVVLVLLLQSCKTTKAIAEGEAARDLSARQVIKRHYKNAPDFKTVSGRMKVDYDNGEISQGLNLSFRLEKDKAIWLSATMNMAKVYMTPDRVSFYNKLDNSYFDGDFSYLSDFLGTELDFEKVQNLLLGQAIFDLNEGNYNALIVNNNYQLKPVNEMNLLKVLFQVEPANFRMGRQLLSDPAEGRVLNIKYRTYQLVEKEVFPEEIGITVEEGSRKTHIDIKYRNVEFNRELTFPYSIPKGYKEIILDSAR